jgi:hypothetical protein
VARQEPSGPLELTCVLDEFGFVVVVAVFSFDARQNLVKIAVDKSNNVS